MAIQKMYVRKFGTCIMGTELESLPQGTILLSEEGPYRYVTTLTLRTVLGFVLCWLGCIYVTLLQMLQIFNVSSLYIS